MRHLLSMMILGLAFCCATNEANAQLPLPGDVDGSGVVDSNDIAPFISHLQNGTYCLQCDLNQDFAVTFADIGPFSDLLTYGVGDVNTDGAVDFLDIAPFSAALSSGQYNVLADINGDYVVNNADIPPFIAILQGN